MAYDTLTLSDELTAQGRKMIPHVKMLPECRNVTKQNCVTLWETDPEGKQVARYCRYYKYYGYYRYYR